MRVVFLTQDDRFFLPAALRYLISRLPGHFEVAAVVLLPVSPFGRKETFVAKAWRTLRVFGTAFFVRYAARYAWNRFFGEGIESVAESCGIRLIRPKKGINHNDSLAMLRELRPDVMVSIAANEIFRRPLIELAPHGILNLHTAKLPAYRGLMPSFWVLAKGEVETAVSVFLVDEGIDSGPILVQEPLRILGRTQSELIHDTKFLGMEAIRTALMRISEGGAVLAENDPKRASYFGFPTRKDIKEFRSRGARF